MLYTSPMLSKMVDPMCLAIERGSPLSADELSAITLERAAHLAGSMPGARQRKEGRQDQAWYWAAIAKCDVSGCAGTGEWLRNKNGWRSVMERDKEKSDHSMFRDHVEYFLQGALGKVELGAVPEDFMSVLAELAIGSPAVCANRALRRIAPGLKADSAEILQASAHIAEGFRSLFN